MVNYVMNWNSSSSWWHWSYIVEWFTAVVLMSCVGLVVKSTRPHCDVFDPTDPSINHSFTINESFPSWVLTIISWALPIAVGAVLVYPNRPKGQKYSHVLHSITLCITQSVSLTVIISSPIKNYAGRLRPDYVDRLRMEGFVTNPPNFVAICESVNDIVMDGRRSFPSGHSSAMFGSWIILFLIAWTRFSSRSGLLQFNKVLCVLTILIFPTIVAVSRTRDYRHNFSDILAGALVGIFCAGVCFNIHFSYSSPHPINRKLAIIRDSEAELSQLLDGTTSHDYTNI